MDSAGSQPKFLVTGATGFVARHLVPALIQAHGPAAVTALVNPERSASEEQFYQELLRQGVAIITHDLLALPQEAPKPPPFDVVYHLAACGETENVRGRFEVNSEGTKNLLAWLTPVLPGKRMVFTGTLASVDQDYPIHPATETTPCHPKTPYGRTKLAAEEYLAQRSREMGFDFTILRLCTIVGRGYRAGGMFSLFPELLRKNALATRLNWPGRASFLDVADLIHILLAAAQNPQMANQVFVCANQELPTFDELLNQIAALHNLPRKRLVLPHGLWQLIARVIWPMVDVTFLPYAWRIFCWRAGLMIHDGISADSAKLNAILGGPYISMAEALRAAYR